MPRTEMLPTLLIATVLAVTVPPVARLETSQPLVALTFDACATSGQANRFDRGVFDILEQRQVPATMFLSGRWIEAHPEAARTLAAAASIEIGNHTWDHARLIRLSEEQIGQEIDRTTAAITALGRAPVALRPPGGEWNDVVVRAAAARGLPLVLWDVVSGDVDGAVPAAQIIAHVTQAVRPGSIVIFHINGRGRYTKDALPDIIDTLRARGFQFVTVSQLLAAPGSQIVAAKSQRFITLHPHSAARQPGAGDTANAHH